MATLLHNRILLYLFFFIALLDFLFLVYTHDLYSATMFVLIGFLVSVFNKNMIVVFALAIIFTNIIKYGVNNIIAREGFEEQEKDDKSNEKPESSTLALDNAKGKTEDFGQDKEVVYTPDSEKSISKTEKMVLEQVELLEKIDKFKPLLDTLNGLTKNIAIVKGLYSAMNDDEDD